jgi:hypothetical protein
MGQNDEAEAATRRNPDIQYLAKHKKDFSQKTNTMK